MPVTDLDHERVEVEDRIDRLQRSGLPSLGVLQNGGGDTADGIPSDAGPVEIGDVGLDLPRGHPAGVERDDLLVQAGQAPLVLLDDLRLERAVAIPRPGDRNRPVIGQERLPRSAVARVARPARRRLAVLVAQMPAQLALQRPLHQPARQIAQKAPGPQDLRLAALAGQELVDHRIGQLLTNLLGQIADRQTGPGALKRLADQLPGALAPRPPAGQGTPRRGRAAAGAPLRSPHGLPPLPTSRGELQLLL